MTISSQFATFVRSFSLLLILSSSLVFSEEMIQPRRLVNAPTAGVLERGSFDFECRIYPGSDNTRGRG